MRLALLHPEWNRPCSVCEQWIWRDKEPGRIQRNAAGDPMERRDDRIPLRCGQCPKVPQWAKESGKDWREMRAAAEPDITDENAEALDSYKRCRATSAFPDDDIVRWYSAIIRDAYDERDSVQSERQTTTINNLSQLLMIYLRRR